MFVEWYDLVKGILNPRLECLSLQGLEVCDFVC
jgi:hypothetical protein